MASRFGTDDMTGANERAESAEALATRLRKVLDAHHLVDVVMPQMSGMVLAKHIHETAPALPIVFTSGYADDDVLHHGVKTGEVAFLRKPYKPEDLLGLIATTLRR